MKKLILDEFKKFKASKLLMGLFMVPVVIMIIVGFLKYTPLYLEHGYMLPFFIHAFWIDIHFFLYGLIVIKMVASEFGSGVVGNSIRAGVDRKQYFISKCITIVIVTAVSELLMSLVLLTTLVLKYGIELDFSFSADFIFKFFMHYLVMLFLTCIMNAVAMLISYICKNFIFATAICFVLFVIVDVRLTINTLNSAICGPLGLIFRSFRSVAGTVSINDVYIFSGEFALALIPSIIVGVVAVAASYIIFKNQKFATIEEKEAEQ